MSSTLVSTTNDSNSWVRSFSPVVSDNAEHPPAVLVLGSMPGRRSLDEQQYYAHPRNAFWWIMSRLLGFDPAIDYSSRLQCLTAAGIALWDVLSDCERPGSLDSRIVSASEIANPISALLSQHPTIQAVVFNGQKAHQSFTKHHRELAQKMALHTLPSTSPAHASLNKEQKLQHWRLLLTLGTRVNG